MASSTKKIALYASYQTGSTLPGYVRFALKHLAKTDFHIVLLTNKRELSKETQQFLKSNDIELFLTESNGFDFGMWRRFLQMQTYNVERILLINDSVVYFKNLFDDYIARAEESNADAVSLLSSNNIHPHLLPFFLYLKAPALGAFFLHLLETPEQNSQEGVFRNFELALSIVFEQEHISMDSLFKTKRDDIFVYHELLNQGVGFIKKQLLQRNFTFNEKAFFIRNGLIDKLNTDYIALAKNIGLDDDFKEEWFPQIKESTLHHKVDLIWEKTLKFTSSLFRRP